MPYRPGKPLAGAMVISMALAFHSAYGAESFYYRNVQPSDPAAAAKPAPGGSTNNPGTAPVTPALAASGVPSGFSTVGDQVTVSFVPSGFSPAAVLRQTGPDVPGLHFSAQNGVLSGNLTDTGQWTFTVGIAEGAKTATASAEIRARYFPPEISLVGPGGISFAGIPFKLQAQATNGASVTTWSDGPSSIGTVDGNGLVTVDAPLGTSKARAAVIGTDAWGQTGSDSLDVNLTTPAVTGLLPAAMRSGQAYALPLGTNLPAATWSLSGSSGGTASVAGATLNLSYPGVAAETPYRITVTARSGKATAAADLSSRILPPFALASQPAALTVPRSSAYATYAPPGTTGTLGTRSYALLKANEDISDTLGTLCPGFAFSRQTGALAGKPTQSTCYQTVSYRITDAGDGTAPPATVSTSAFLFSVLSDTTFDQQPAGLSVEQGASAVTTGHLTQNGGYVSPLQFWRVTNASNSGDAKPSWFSLDCPLTSPTCTVTVAPTASVPTGTYGPYALMAGDGTGFYKQSDPFTVTVRSPTAALTLTQPAAFQQNSAAGSACTALPVRNTSANVATGLSLSLSSTTDFQSCAFATAPCGTTLAAGATCNFGVVLKSPAAGNKSATATVAASNVTSVPGHTVNLTGNFTSTLSGGFQIFATPGTYTFTPKAPGQVVRVFVIGGGNGAFGPWGNANGMGGGSGYFAANPSYTLSGAVTVRVGAGTSGGNYTGGVGGGLSSFGNVTVAAGPAGNTASMDGGSGGGGFSGEAGGSAGSRGAGSYSQNNVRYGYGQVSAPDLTIFKHNTLTYGAGGPPPSPGSATPGAGGGGGVLVNGSGGNATQGSPGGATVSNALAGKPGQGYGAGGGGGYYAGGSANLNAGFGGQGSDGLVYVEWSD